MWHKKLLRLLSVSAALCIALTGCADRSVGLFTGLSESEANRLVAYLDSNGVNAHKTVEREGVSVSVAANELARAARLAAQGGLPRSAHKGFGTVFQKEGLISSPLEERGRLTYAVSQEIEGMLSDIDGVLGTRVNVVIPERRNGRNTDLPAAAVLIRYRADMELDLLEMKVRRLVAASVPGLIEGDPQQISVSFLAVPSGGDLMLAHAPSNRIDSSASVARESIEMNTLTETSTRDRSGNGGTSLVTLMGIAAGVSAAIGALAWSLRGQLLEMFRRNPARSLEADGEPIAVVHEPSTSAN